MLIYYLTRWLSEPWELIPMTDFREVFPPTGIRYRQVETP